MNLSKIRSMFPVIRKWNYLNHAVVSPLPRPVKKAIDDFYTQRVIDGGLHYSKWFDEVEEARKDIGKLINSSGLQISFFQNTSHALNTVADILPLKRGDEIILTDLEFPSNTFPWIKLQDKGIRFTWLRSHNGIINPVDVEKIINDRTRVVAISHVCYYNGFKLDLESIADITSSRGIFLVVDAMQSIGAIKIDVRKTNIDFLASNSYKWLLGPFGVTILYCKEEWIKELRPASVGWYSIKDIWSREIDEYEFSDTARRFELGHPNFAGIRGLKAATELILKIGPEIIERRVTDHTNKIREELKLCDKIEMLSPEDGISGITLFRIRSKDTIQVVNAMINNGIVVFSQRWNDDIGVKVSPHFYNTEDEIDAFITAVKSLSK